MKKLEFMVRVPPVPFDDLEGMAGWLETLALQGLYYDGLFFSYHFFTSVLFKKGPPAKVRYRIDPAKGSLYGEPPQGLVELYKESGWEYVDSPTRFCHIFMTLDATLSEPYDSPESLGQALAPQITSRKTGLLLAGLLLALDVFLIWYLAYSALVLHRPIWFYAVLLALLVVALALSIQNYRRLVKWKEQLDQGQETIPYTPGKTTPRALALLALSVLCLLIDLWLFVG